MVDMPNNHNLFPLPYWAPALWRVPRRLQLLNEAYARGGRGCEGGNAHRLLGFATSAETLNEGVQSMKLNASSGAALAAAAALLVLSAAAPVAPAAAASKVKCFGVNSCKGQAACKTASNACKGQNACKGKGFLVMSKSACIAKGGTSS